jgi:hypothetical protein
VTFLHLESSSTFEYTEDLDGEFLPYARSLSGEYNLSEEQLIAKEVVFHHLAIYFRSPTQNQLFKRLILMAEQVCDFLDCPVDRDEVEQIIHAQERVLTSDQIERLSLWVSSLIQERARENLKLLPQLAFDLVEEEREITGRSDRVSTDK